mmetsp:Transcript_16928/g.58969  ORF Transcript_16928/g.58969 Transcript_16928/m.58969 type:complete len:248 (+) Transcript_16928:393-1136(+)
MVAARRVWSSAATAECCAAVFSSALGLGRLAFPLGQTTFAIHFVAAVSKPHLCSGAAASPSQTASEGDMDALAPWCSNETKLRRIMPMRSTSKSSRSKEYVRCSTRFSLSQSPAVGSRLPGAPTTRAEAEARARASAEPSASSTRPGLTPPSLTPPYCNSSVVRPKSSSSSSDEDSSSSSSSSSSSNRGALSCGVPSKLPSDESADPLTECANLAIVDAASAAAAGLRRGAAPPTNVRSSCESRRNG